MEKSLVLSPKVLLSMAEWKTKFYKFKTKSTDNKSIDDETNALNTFKRVGSNSESEPQRGRESGVQCQSTS